MTHWSIQSFYALSGVTTKTVMGAFRSVPETSVTTTKSCWDNGGTDGTGTARSLGNIGEAIYTSSYYTILHLQVFARNSTPKH